MATVRVRCPRLRVVVAVMCELRVVCWRLVEEEGDWLKPPLPEATKQLGGEQSSARARRGTHPAISERREL
jgi:hypothetical protein